MDFDLSKVKEIENISQADLRRILQRKVENNEITGKKFTEIVTSDTYNNWDDKIDGPSQSFYRAASGVLGNISRIVPSLLGLSFAVFAIMTLPFGAAEMFGFAEAGAGSLLETMRETALGWRDSYLDFFVTGKMFDLPGFLGGGAYTAILKIPIAIAIAGSVNKWFLKKKAYSNKIERAKLLSDVNEPYVFASKAEIKKDIEAYEQDKSVKGAALIDYCLADDGKLDGMQRYNAFNGRKNADDMKNSQNGFIGTLRKYSPSIAMLGALPIGYNGMGLLAESFLLSPASGMLGFGLSGLFMFAGYNMYQQGREEGSTFKKVAGVAYGVAGGIKLLGAIFPSVAALGVTAITWALPIAMAVGFFLYKDKIMESMQAMMGAKKADEGRIYALVGDKLEFTEEEIEAGKKALEQQEKMREAQENFRKGQEERKAAAGAKKQAKAAPAAGAQMA